MRKLARVGSVLGVIAGFGLIGGCAKQSRDSAGASEACPQGKRVAAERSRSQSSWSREVPAQEGSGAAASVDGAEGKVEVGIENGAETGASAAIRLREFLPHIRLNVDARVVEFDGMVPIHAPDDRVTRVYLEVLACSSDTREHEAVVVTQAKPSQVHAALLAIGLEPGKPGSYSWLGERVEATAPTGPRVRVEVIVGDGEASLITDWAVDARNGRTLTEALREVGHAMLFAGSVSTERSGGVTYLGDGGGTLVGLSTFGTETVACETMFNPDSAIEEPVWIANTKLVPPAGTAVRVRIIAE